MDIYELKQYLGKESVILLDIRQKSDYEISHIKGAVYASDDFITGLLSCPEKDKMIICCCYHGFSSLNAKQFFEDNGFKNVHSVDGGFEAFQKEFSSEIT